MVYGCPWQCLSLCVPPRLVACGSARLLFACVHAALCVVAAALLASWPLPGFHSCAGKPAGWARPGRTGGTLG